MSVNEDRSARIVRIYDEVAASYDQVGPPFYALSGQELVVRVRPDAGARVLDVGCGRGACLFPAAELVGAAGEVVGIDSSPQMVRQTSAEAARRGAANVVVVAGDAQTPGFGDASFDVLLAGFVLRLLADPVAALRSYARLLRPGGRLGASIYVSSFDDVRWHPVQTALEPFFVDGPPPTVPQIDPAERLVALVDQAGFEDVDVVDRRWHTRFADPDEWWRYLWASGYRGMVDRIPPERREAARQVALAAGRDLIEPDGSLVMPQDVRYLTATRAS